MISKKQGIKNMKSTTNPLDEKMFEITNESGKYPRSLLSLVDPPKVVRVRGSVSLLSSPKLLAVVGSRHMTSYGFEATREFVSFLARRGIVIVSGFMYGVDTTAHEAALSVNGKTIAVLGYGIDLIKGEKEQTLYSKVIHSGGAVISEYPNDFKAQRWTFPKRNRIVAGLSTLGTLVIEAAENSGSLITASYADALNRPLYAVPGPIFSLNSVGVNTIIKNGIAKLVMKPEDIWEEIKKSL